MVKHDLVVVSNIEVVSGLVGFRARDMKAIDLQRLDLVLAGIGMRSPILFQSPSGWVLNGPAKRPKSGTGYGLVACYPKEAMPIEKSVPSIDFQPPADRQFEGKSRGDENGPPRSEGANNR